VAKWIEGVAYILKFERNEKLEEIVDNAVEEIIKNQDEYGYFNSHFLVTDQELRFKIRDRHELYCAGHLMEAAAAYYEATGKDAFLKAMCKYADYIERIFKIEDSATYTTPGHPELELALMKLYETTGEKRYAELSKYFIDKHGNNDKDQPIADWATIHYGMDEVPLREISEPKGHSVRALYLLSGMADVAKEYGDQELFDACERCYQSIISKKMYITGGVGSTSHGEAFSVDYYLPNRRAYAETCAGIALAMFCLRMQKLQTNAKYADTMERVIYNGVLSGISLSGNKFFYENPTEVDVEFNHINPATNTRDRFPDAQRAEIFGCSCCPPNMVRFLASIGGYAYGYDEDTVYINLFMDSTMQNDDTTVTVRTAYPADGKLNIHCETSKKYLAVRIPEWCETFTTDSDYTVRDGYMIFDASEKSDFSIELDMPVTVIQCNPNVHDNAGRIAITRGPVVYCAEGLDNGRNLQSVYLDPNAEYIVGDCEFQLPTITTKAYRPADNNALYYKANCCMEEISFKLIPYYAFANREETSMQIWFLKK